MTSQEIKDLIQEKINNLQPHTDMSGIGHLIKISLNAILDEIAFIEKKEISIKESEDIYLSGDYQPDNSI